MTDRKKPGVAFWATVVVVGLVLYVLSIGPAWWISDRVNSPTFRRCYYCFYSPIGWALTKGPEPMQTAIDWYLGLFVSG